MITFVLEVVRPSTSVPWGYEQLATKPELAELHEQYIEYQKKTDPIGPGPLRTWQVESSDPLKLITYNTINGATEESIEHQYLLTRFNDPADQTLKEWFRDYYRAAGCITRQSVQITSTANVGSNSSARSS